jgi:DNA repair and recombination protein RAD54 and RAD54-like protein
MWKCLKGQEIETDSGSNNIYHGCILADGMGLGKTLQCITLIWTLLRQGRTSKPEINNALIIVPKGVVREWVNEFSKFLGRRITICSIDKNSDVSQRDLKLFLRGIRPGKEALIPVLITSYDFFLINKDKFYATHIDLLLCDEAHDRLANQGTKLYEALNNLRTPRRIFTTGTPLTNELDNLYNLINFVNPGLLGSVEDFQTNYGNSIPSIVDRAASPMSFIMGLLHLRKLHAKLMKFMIRRTHADNFPPKHEFLVFCETNFLQNDLQIRLVKAINMTDQTPTKRNTKSRLGDTMGYVCALKNICNHPEILREKFKQSKSQGVDLKFLEPCFDIMMMDGEPEKMQVLASLLEQIKTTTKDHVIIASYSTEALSQIEKLCQSKGYSAAVLIGKTTAKERNEIIEDFNDGKYFILLISVKTGGVGLNLAQANRLIMYDPAWTAAADRQAISRIWRLDQSQFVFFN